MPSAAEVEQYVAILRNLDVAITFVLGAALFVWMLNTSRLYLRSGVQRVLDDNTKLEAENRELTKKYESEREQRIRLEMQMVGVTGRAADVAEKGVNEGQVAFEMALQLFDRMQGLRGGSDSKRAPGAGASDAQG